MKSKAIIIGLVVVAISSAALIVGLSLLSPSSLVSSTKKVQGERTVTVTPVLTSFIVEDGFFVVRGKGLQKVLLTVPEPVIDEQTVPSPVPTYRMILDDRSSVDAHQVWRLAVLTCLSYDPKVIGIDGAGKAVGVLPLVVDGRTAGAGQAICGHLNRTVTEWVPHDGGWFSMNVPRWWPIDESIYLTSFGYDGLILYDGSEDGTFDSMVKRTVDHRKGSGVCIPLTPWSHEGISWVTTICRERGLKLSETLFMAVRPEAEETSELEGNKVQLSFMSDTPEIDSVYRQMVASFRFISKP